MTAQTVPAPPPISQPRRSRSAASAITLDPISIHPTLHRSASGRLHTAISNCQHHNSACSLAQLHQHCLSWRRTTRLWKSWVVSCLFWMTTISGGTHTVTGGSFGKVFKAIDRTTGETVAIKHVRSTISSLTTTTNPPRSTLKTAARNWQISKPRSPSSAPATAHTSPNTRPASSRASSYGSSWSILEEAQPQTWYAHLRSAVTSRELADNCSWHLVASARRTLPSPAANSSSASTISTRLARFTAISKPPTYFSQTKAGSNWRISASLHN